MKIASIAVVKAKLSAYLKASEEGPVIVTRNGRAVALLLTPANEEDLERLVFAYSSRLRRILDASNSAVEAGKVVPHDAFWRNLQNAAKAGVIKPAPRRKGKR
jgi:prevent-host-death family protein